MDRNQVEHAIRASCALIGEKNVIVVGSQSLHAYYEEHKLPEIVSKSKEIDIYVDNNQPDMDDLKRNTLSAEGGEDFLFHRTHGYYLDAVEPSLIVLPDGWRERVQPITVLNPIFSESDPSRGPKKYRGLCIHPSDLAVAKFAAFRPKDIEALTGLLGTKEMAVERVTRNIEATLASGVVSDDSRQNLVTALNLLRA